MNQNENITYQVSCNVANTVLRGKFIAEMPIITKKKEVKLISQSFTIGKIKMKLNPKKTERLKY